MPPARLRKRARDLDRIEVCGALDMAYADGQLDTDEHRSRTAAAMSATTLAELRALIADLQVPPGRLTPLDPVAPARTYSASPPTEPIRSRRTAHETTPQTDCHRGGPGPRRLRIHAVRLRDGGDGPEVLISVLNGDLLQSGVLQVRPDGTVMGVYPYEPR